MTCWKQQGTLLATKIRILKRSFKFLEILFAEILQLSLLFAGIAGAIFAKRGEE
jgi:hypothetical protein